jgi:hypothetical protein
MEAVLLLDQRSSRGASDRVSLWAERLNERYSNELTLSFVRTAGDEMQGLTNSSSALIEIVLEAVEDGGWWVGIGIGPVERPLGITSRESSGEAFWLAREALERSKSQRATRPFALRAAQSVSARNLTTCLHVLTFMVLRRTTRQKEVALRAREGLSVAEIAEQWSVTEQAVRQLLLAAGVNEEQELRVLAIDVASGALQCTETN